MSFIKSYLGKGEKAEIPIINYLSKIDSLRISHIVSCFILGIIIYEKCDRINKAINKLLTRYPDGSEDTNENRFKYIWALTCLYHDFGYAVENHKRVLTGCQLKELYKVFPKRPSYIPNQFSLSKLKKYNEYRQCCWNTHDHGIIAGMQLYNDLSELRQQKEQERHNNLYWGKGLLEDYRMAAWTIVCHNVYFTQVEDKCAPCYECKHISNLLYEDKKREIKLQDHPFIFFLCLVDTIEPIKVTHSIEKLKNINIEINMDSITVCSSLNGVQNVKLHGIINGLNKWLCDTENEMIKVQ